MTESRVNLGLENFNWQNIQTFTPASYICGFCGDKVASKEGYLGHDPGGRRYAYIRICSGCRAPTFFTPFGERFPSNTPGKPVAGLPDDLSKLYTEARLSAGAGAYTAAVLACRKMLMHIAVAEGAKAGLTFIEYVEHLDKNGFVPPRGKVWVDYIRTKGNEANHEIQLMSEQDAIALIGFVEMLLRFIYEFPVMVPKQLNP